MNSIDILKALDHIGAEGSKNAKQDLLALLLKDEEFRDVVRFALDPFVTFGVRPAKYTGFAGNFIWTARTWELLMLLQTRQLTGGAAAARIEAEYKNLDADSAELLWRVLNKDLRGGFGESSCNKAVKGFFKSFPYQRCSLMSDTDVTKWDWANGIISQKKADGMYVNSNNEDGTIAATLLTSRQGEPFPLKGFERIHLSISMLSPGTQTHGELLVFGPDGKELERAIGNGMINEVRQGGNWEEGHYPVLEVWDQIPLSEVKPKAKIAIPYLDRLRGLTKQIKAAERSDLRVIETRIVRSLAEAFKHYLEMLQAGLEGTVIKKPTMGWKDGTSNEQIKLKLKAQAEFRVTGYKEGKQGKKTAATFGSVELVSEDGLVQFNCSGMSDDIRKEINANREKYMDGIVTVEFNGILTSRNLAKKPHSVFLPVWIEHRTDKSVADTFAQVQDQVANAISKIEALAKSE